MARLGSRKQPVVLRVRTQERAAELFVMCQELGVHVIVGVEPGKPEDITDLDRILNPQEPIRVENRIGRNDPCPCGSGRKAKKCCPEVAT